MLLHLLLVLWKPCAWPRRVTDIAKRRFTLPGTQTKRSGSPTFRNEHWHTMVASKLNMMLEETGYPALQRMKYMSLFHDHVMKHLGPPPFTGETKWESFMNDDYIPIELGLSWEPGPRPNGAVKFSFEPIGVSAGSSFDPLNLECMDGFIARAKELSERACMKWFRLFEKQLVWTDAASFYVETSSTTGNKPTHRSQMFFAFDLETEATILKAYFCSEVMAFMTRKSKLEIVTRAVRSTGALDVAWDEILSYLSAIQVPDHEKPRPEIVAIDCIDPNCSRVKVYFRAPSTSFRSISDMITLGGRFETPYTRAATVIIFELWKELSASKLTTEDELPDIHHLTNGILYYFELRPGDPVPYPKVYLPVRHYMSDDSAISRLVATLLRKEGYNPEAYLRIVSRLTKKKQHLDRPSHTYIAIAVKRSAVTMHVYMNPGVH